MLKTLSTSLEVLKIFTKEKPSWGGRELSAHLGENHTKIYRILETLEKHRFLMKNKETKKYSLGFGVWELGNTFTANFNIVEAIHPILEKLSQSTNESVFLTILDGEEGLTFDAVEAGTTIRFSVSIGSRTPLYAGASYRSILAHMPEDFIETYLTKQKTKFTNNTMTDTSAIRENLELVRRDGFAVSEGEYTADVIAVAIPVFIKGAVIGSLTVSGPMYRIENEQIENFVAELRGIKSELEQVLEMFESHFGMA